MNGASFCIKLHEEIEVKNDSAGNAKCLLNEISQKENIEKLFRHSNLCSAPFFPKLSTSSSTQGLFQKNTFSNTHALSLEETCGEMVGDKSCNIKFLHKELPECIRFPASVVLPFGVFEKVLSEDINKEVAKKIAHLSDCVDRGDILKLKTIQETVLQMKAPRRMKPLQRSFPKLSTSSSTQELFQKNTFSNMYALPLEETCGEMVGEKSCSIKFLHKELPECIRFPASVVLPFGVFENVLSEDINKVTCSLCSETMDPEILGLHKGEKCPKRIVTCDYCEFPLPAVGLFEHQEVCGNMTELCHICNRYIRPRERVAHEVACNGVPAEIPRSGHQPVNVDWVYGSAKTSSLRWITRSGG